ncbi:MAG: tetratricopeptide repeat protein, partial [Ferruginibacter sp.]|nr:tetratricopeptide repeat protein [Rhodoferax sp.]
AQNPYPMVVATPSVSHGSSGGGLFDGQGQLLGITAAVLGTGQNLNLVLPADAVAALLAHGSPRPAATAMPAPEKRWNAIAESLKASGDWAGLEKHSRAWSQAQPSAALPLAYLGLAQHVLNRDAEAEATLRQALALDGNQPFVWLNLASVLSSLQQPEQAEQALQQAQLKSLLYDEPSRKRAEWLNQEGKNSEALVHIKEALRLEPSRSYSWTLLGKIEGSLGHGPAASRALATALRLDVANESPSSQPVEALVAIGWDEFKQNHFGPAEDAMRKAIAMAPTSALAWNGLGAVLAKTQRNMQAVDAFTQSLKQDPNDVGVLSNRAGVRLNLHQNELARVDAQRAIEIAPQHAAAWSVFGRIQLSLKNYREASKAFEKLATFAPLNAVDMTLWGESQLGMGSIESARATLQKAEALDPQLTNMHLVMAKLLGNNGDVPGALSYLNRALVSNPTDPVAWSSKGYALLKLGRPPEAAEALETAVQLDPALANSWINLGEAQMRNRN